MLVSFYNPWYGTAFTDWEHGIPNKPLGHDNLRYFYPIKKLIKESLSAGELPLWNPYNFSGTPLLADGQSAVFNPFTLFYVFLPLEDAFSILVILMPLLAFTFMYLLLKSYKLSNPACFFGAFALATSGYFAVWTEENPAIIQTAIWLPLLLCLFENWLENKKSYLLALFMFFTSWMLVSGFLQLSIYELLFSVFYGTYRLHARSRVISAYISFYLAIFLAVLSTSVYLVPTFEAYKQSPREYSDATSVMLNHLVPWTHLATLLVPDWLGNPATYNYSLGGTYYDKIFYIGLVPFIFLLLNWFSKKDKLEKILWTISLVVIFLGFKTPLTKWLYTLPIPILSSMLPSRIFYLSTVTTIILSSFGFQRLLTANKNISFRSIKKIIVIAGVGFIVIFLVAGLLGAELLSVEIQIYSFIQSIRSLVISPINYSITKLISLLRNTFLAFFIVSSVLLCIIFYIRKKNTIFIFLIFIILIFQAVYFIQKNTYVSERQFMYPGHPVLNYLRQHSGIYRVAFANENSVLKSNMNSVFALYSPEGLNPVYSRRYGQIVQAAQENGLISENKQRIEVRIDGSLITQKDYQQRMQRLFNLLGVKFLVYRRNDKDEFEDAISGDWLRAWENTEWVIFENTQVFPKAFFVDNAVFQKDEQKIADLLFDPNMNLLTTVVLEEEINSIPNKEGKAEIELVTYGKNLITMLVSSEKSGFVAVNDTYFPGWKAYIDANPAKLLRANYAFRAVPVTEGKHAIQIRYEPYSFKLGLRLTIIEFALSIIFLVWEHLISNGKNVSRTVKYL